MSEYEAWVGRSVERDAYLDPWPAQALRATLGDLAGPAGDTLPCLWQWLYFLETAPREQIGTDGHPRRGGFMPPIELPRRMFAGGRNTVLQPLKLGHEAKVTETILKVEQKRGGDNPLYLVTVGFAYAQAGVLCVSEERDIVYLGGKPGAAEANPPLKPIDGEAPWRDEVTPDPVMLMRYSALTFNGHRIHYDGDYTRTEEGYPGLVVHGPLTATLLEELARRNAGRPVASFAFRAMNPMFAGAPVRLRGGPADDGKATVTAYTPDAKVAMSATVTFAD